MVYSKRFPKEKQVVSWKEVTLTPEEERAVIVEAHAENVLLLRTCLVDAAELVSTSGWVADGYVVDFSALAQLACSLFEKRASHVVFAKERACRAKLT